MYALCRFGQNYQTPISAVVCYMATSVKYQQLLFDIIRECGSSLLFLLYFLSIRTVDPADGGYKEGSDRTLLGPIQASAVHWSGVMTKLWYLFCVRKREISNILCILFMGKSQCNSNSALYQHT